MAEQTFPDGTVRWKEIVGCNDTFRWYISEPGDPYYSLALMVAEEVMLNGKWEPYAS